jgi:hypothetical protein
MTEQRSTELVRTEQTTLAEKMQWAKAMATATMLPKQYQRNPGNLLYALEYADALGVSRISALTSIYVIDGKPSASADLIAGMVRRAGHRLRVQGDDTYAEAHLIRADDPDFTYVARWDLDKARAAGLVGKGVWKSYPAAMLRARAITEVARMGASDALFGCVYTPEELGAEVDHDGDFIVGEVVDEPVVRPPQTPPQAAPESPLLDTASDLAKAMYASLRDAGFSKDDAPGIYQRVTGREGITSSSQLTDADAREVLRYLDQLRRTDTTTGVIDDEPIDAKLVEDAS